MAHDNRVGGRARRRPQKIRYAAPALDKGMDILELFASESKGLTGSDVARRLGRTVGEIFRMLVCLEKRGYICQVDSDECYQITLKLFEIAHQHHPLEQLVTRARPLMHEVARKTGQSCHLAMLSNGKIVVVAQVDAPGSMGFSLKLGAQVDLLDTAAGHVILAFQSPEVRFRSLAASERRARYPSVAALHRHLAKICHRGYEEMKSYQIRGVLNISFPVFNQHGDAVAAMSVPCLARIGSRIGPAQVRMALQAATNILSAGIGGKKAQLPLAGD